MTTRQRFQGWEIESSGFSTPWKLLPLALLAVWPALASDTIKAGVGMVDITPAEPVVLAGSPTRLKSTAVGTHLYAKALVLAGNG